MSDTDTRAPFPFRSIDDVDTAATRSGSKFFLPETLKWWRTRMLGNVHAGRVFVTSEPRVWDGPRVYTVRLVTADPIEDGRPNATDGWSYNIATVGDMLDSPTTPSRAHALARAVADRVRAGLVPDSPDYDDKRELGGFAAGFRAAKGW